MKNLLVAIMALLLPMLVWYQLPMLLFSGIDKCRIDAIFIEYQHNETVVTRSEWSISHHYYMQDIGHYVGQVRAFDRQGKLLFNSKIYRAYATEDRIVGNQMQSTTVSVSPLSQNTLSPELEKKYLHPILQLGNVSLTSFFRLQSGTYLFGLPDRPRGICMR